MKFVNISLCYMLHIYPVCCVNYSLSPAEDKVDK